MDEAKLDQMKYPDLLSYAKELGINNYGKYTGKPTKELIMEKIKEHFDTIQQQQAAKINLNKTPKKAVDVLRTIRLSPPEQLQQRQSKRHNHVNTATPNKLAKKNVEQRLDQALEQNQVEPQEETQRKASKKSKKKENVNKEEEEENGAKKVKKTKKVDATTAATASASVDEQEATTSMPEKVSRRKQAVVTYKEVDAKAKLRSDEPKHKSKKTTVKETSQKTNADAVASLDDVVTEKEKKAKKKTKAQRKHSENEADGCNENITDDQKPKKTKNKIKKKKSSSKLTNKEDTKEKASTSPQQPEPSVEAEVIEISDEETAKPLVAKKNNKKVSSRKQCSLPQMIASRLQQNSPSEVVPSPSTHTLVASDSPMNSVEDTNIILTSKTNSIDTPKAQAATSLNRTRNSSTHNTPAASNLVLEQTQDIAQMNENDEENDLSEEIRLEFNEDDDEDNENQINEQQHEEQKSILTDDEEESNKENNMTRDDLNTTVDKSFGALPCTSFYKSSTTAVNNNPIDANLVEPSTSSEANNVVVAQEVATVEPFTVVEPPVQPKPIGHARIVRPTQKVETIETVLVSASSKVGPIEEAVVVKKTVEVVRREAGPRIVKPCAATVSGADDETTTTNVTSKKLASKVKSTSKMPDFKAIHEKNANKLESIKDFVERKAQQKINKPTKSPHMPKHMSLAAMPTTSKAASSFTDSVDNNQKSLAKTPMSKFTSRVRNYLSSGSSASSASGCATNVNQAKEGTTPKIAKMGAVHAMQNMASSVISTLIPRFKNNNNKEPSTPKQEISSSISNLNTNQVKTPSNLAPKTPTNKPSTITSLFQSAKKSAMKKASLNGEAPSAAPTMSSLLASSSFLRRKSYDLNCSAKKPLNYKPHVGKVKPLAFDIDAKTALFKNSLNTNLNETKVVDKSTSTNIAMVAAKVNLDMSKKPSSSIFKSGRVEKKLKTKKEKKRDLIDAGGSDENRNPLMA